MAGWEPATDEQKEYLAALQEEIRVTKELEDNGHLNRKQISKQIDMALIALGRKPQTIAEAAGLEEDDNVIPFERPKPDAVVVAAEPEPWQIADAAEREVFSNLERLNYAESWNRNAMFREPMDLRVKDDGDINWIAIWKKFPNRTVRHYKFDRTVEYGWRWVCRHPDHKHPVHGGSNFGFSETIVAASMHYWKKHRDA